HAAPFYMYLPYMFAGFFPWSIFLPVAIISAVRRQRIDTVTELSGDDTVPGRTENQAVPVNHPSQGRLFLLVWVGLVFILYSAVPSKVVIYLLTIYPAAALITADWFVQEIDRRKSRTLVWCVASLAALLVVAIAGVQVAAMKISNMGLNTVPRLE